MNNQLHQQVCAFGFWSSIVMVVAMTVSVLLPLDVPNGYDAVHDDRVMWLVANRGMFIAGWVNQIIAMLSLSGVLVAGAWLAAPRNPLLALLAAFMVALSVMAFIIPKFIAIWTIPLLADAASSNGAGAEMANTLLLLLNVSVPFSLYTSFDYLGFWLYSLFALLLTVPLYDGSRARRVSSVTLGVFGVAYQILLACLLLGAIAASDIESYFIGVSLLLVFHVIAMVPVFRRAQPTSTL